MAATQAAVATAAAVADTVVSAIENSYKSHTRVPKRARTKWKLRSSIESLHILDSFNRCEHRVNHSKYYDFQ